MSLSAEQLDELRPMVSGVAITLARQYQTLERSDLEQECWVWAITHPAKLSEYLSEAEDGGMGRIRRSMTNAARRWAETERAAASGYSPDDVYWYSITELGVLLGAALDPYGAQVGRGDDEPARGGDPAVAGNWVTLLTDVRRAYDALGLGDRELLAQRYSYGLLDREMASLHGVGTSTVDRWLKRALRHLQDQLGGPRPGPDEPDPEYTGQTPTITNATARYRIGHQYDE